MPTRRRTFIETARFNLARTRLLTDTAVLSTLALGFFAVLGWKAFALVVGSAAALWAGLPAALTLRLALALHLWPTLRSQA